MPLGVDGIESAVRRRIRCADVRFRLAKCRMVVIAAAIQGGRSTRTAIVVATAWRMSSKAWAVRLLVAGVHRVCREAHALSWALQLWHAAIAAGTEAAAATVEFFHCRQRHPAHCHWGIGSALRVSSCISCRS